MTKFIPHGAHFVFVPEPAINLVGRDWPVMLAPEVHTCERSGHVTTRKKLVLGVGASVSLLQVTRQTLSLAEVKMRLPVHDIHESGRCSRSFSKPLYCHQNIAHLIDAFYVIFLSSSPGETNTVESEGRSILILGFSDESKSCHSPACGSHCEMPGVT